MGMSMITAHQMSRFKSPAWPSAADGRVADEAWACLSHLVAAYPGFETWYWSKVEPGLALGSRRIFVQRSGSALLGVVIAKREREERKLCTVWTAASARRAGVASSLIAEAMDWLDVDRPLLTVPEERMPEFAGIVSMLHFERTQVLASYYRPGCAEHVFNGCLAPRQDC
jgi:GNAT superfamily N-acetyltransferase